MIYRYLTFVLFLCGCSTIKVPETFVHKEILTSEFTIASWQKITNPQSPYKIYIEGDGYAFNTHGKISSDPTPKGTLMRELAFGDTHENVIYLARPCQYVKDRKCEKKYWSTARFSQEVLDSEYQAVKSIVLNNPVTLIGFSGGAQIAGLLAVDTDLNIKKVITIAGNLDHLSWTTYHHLPPISESLNLADKKSKFSKIPQHHYIGKKDNVIPPLLTQTSVANQNLITIVPQADHGHGWKSIYSQIRNIE